VTMLNRDADHEARRRRAEFLPAAQDDPRARTSPACASDTGGSLRWRSRTAWCRRWSTPLGQPSTSWRLRTGRRTRCCSGTPAGDRSPGGDCVAKPLHQPRTRPNRRRADILDRHRHTTKARQRHAGARAGRGCPTRSHRRRRGPDDTLAPTALVRQAPCVIGRRQGVSAAQNAVRRHRRRCGDLNATCCFHPTSGAAEAACRKVDWCR
jgi:hypothetical protein